MFDPSKVAYGLRNGRPDNRRYVYKGDRRDILTDKPLMGPDAHGVYWEPVRAYYENDETLIVFAPVHPDHLAARVANRVASP